MLMPYKNEPVENYSNPADRAKMEEALKLIDSRKGQHFPLVIDGEKIDTEGKITVINPSKSSEVLGTTAKANKDLAEKAIQAAAKAFETWKYVPAEERANYLINAAAILKRRKHEFAAQLVEEAGKIWVEANADVAEAIDFLEYYARQMLKVEHGMDLIPLPGTKNTCKYIPIGAGLVIAPWNFPLAILVGMTSAAIVAGNTVVVKPASTTPLVAGMFMDVLAEIGLPKGVVNFLPGPGGEVGDYLTDHPLTRFINFTGSAEVGLRINERAAKLAPGQKWIKRVIAEMGGKDFIQVDSEADLDLAASAIVTAAFGFQGQKCSACSRAIIDEKVYDELVEKILAKTKELKVGPAREYGVDVACVIDENSLNKVMKYVEIGKTEGKLLAGGVRVSEDGYFVAPTIFGDIDRNARLAQEEVFGPFVALIKCKDFKDGIEVANGTVYGLTGAFISKNREKIEIAKRELHCGNLYINRKCTGALVGAEPFGGFNMSGTDSKAGGADYLLLFLQAKTISELL
ncbi:delta-1-pyrroline-5-carboxylate dehydrogenase [Hathewaya proteolytica DSM 3090]|uniref:L-glutamate gamma-semialdehyde dehydrogenase n=1 Tax=Hathewaya proteolytica DSM 3090 TaxID=1121331 RepID=A0A1M6PIC2_9CLOT|nr:L-glutamate gamma-semialdehyde dehydrogenase [Hathewaya proteolytica]SHK07682.1 delta-1-pyrroline-5-carboxylate dehydrogenase [Hathewaya proteolytica DSM 3090]